MGPRDEGTRLFVQINCDSCDALCCKLSFSDDFSCCSSCHCSYSFLDRLLLLWFLVVIKVVVILHRLVAVCTLDGAIPTHPKFIKPIIREPSPSKLKTPAVLAFDGT